MFSAGDVQELAKLMKHCIDNPNEVIAKGEVARSLRRNYSSQVQCDQFETLFQEMMV
jgi:hypothetical protein